MICFVRRHLCTGLFVPLFAILLASAAFAQDERPELSVPEPTRKSKKTSPSGPFIITVVDYNDAIKQRDYLGQAVPELVAFMSKAVKLKAEIGSNKRKLYDPRIAESILLYMTGYDATIRLNDTEKKALGDYLKGGGLLYTEDIIPLSDGNTSGPSISAGRMGTPFDRQLKALIQDPLVLGRQGRAWNRVPKTHPLFTSYFEFLDGPPLSGAPNGDVTYLETIEIKGRTAVIFSDLNISWFWANADAEGRDRSLQFGTNLVVFALAKKLAGRPLPIRR
ncbi:MAG: DUF4159 domain-containing protein [Candidatus Latescibacterota bacterium]|jgi:hypothetical protein